MTDMVSEWIRGLDRAKIAYEENVSGVRLTTFGAGGSIRLLIKPKEAKDLLSICNLLQATPRVIGGGSNVLFSSAGYEDALVTLDAFRSERYEKGVIEVGAGVKMPRFASFALTLERKGAEFASGIPGTVGGAIKTNAGAFGQAISDGLKYVIAFIGNKIERLYPGELGLSYHKSDLPKDCVILSAAFSLPQGEKIDISERMREMKVRRATTQPKERSAGSVFRKCGNVPAAIYIEKTGLKGLKIGGARLSRKHCNFIVNEGGASSEDFFAVGEIVRKKVREEFGVTLEYEPEKIGW